MLKTFLVLMLSVTVAIAAPSKAEVEQFAKQMGASFDEVAGYEAKAEAAEKAGKFDEAERFWTGLWQGATQLKQHALLAARAGTFQDPMKFPTKAGKLTAAQYLKKLDGMSSKGDARAAKASLAVANAQIKQRKQTYVQGVAANVAALDELVTKAKRAGKSEAPSARIALSNVERNAKSLASSVREAEKQGRAPKGATYPTKPKPLVAGALAVRLGLLSKDAATARAELDKKYPAPKPVAKAPTKATPGARPTGPAPSGPASGPAPSAPAAEPEPAAESAAPVCDPGNINCDNGMTTCCEGERCLAAGYIVYSDHYEADYYMCMDPMFATAPPVMN